MIAHFAHDIATAYADASHADAETCAALCAFASGLTAAVIAHPYALAKRLARADFGDDLTVRGNPDDYADALRDVLAPISRDAARFYRAQLALPLPCPFADEAAS